MPGWVSFPLRTQSCDLGDAFDRDIAGVRNVDIAAWLSETIQFLDQFEMLSEAFSLRAEHRAIARSTWMPLRGAQVDSSPFGPGLSETSQIFAFSKQSDRVSAIALSARTRPRNMAQCVSEMRNWTNSYAVLIERSLKTMFRYSTSWLFTSSSKRCLPHEPAVRCRFLQKRHSSFHSGIGFSRARRSGEGRKLRRQADERISPFLRKGFMMSHAGLLTFLSGPISCPQASRPCPQ